MTGGWSFVVWIVILAVPIGIFLASGWARSRRAGEERLDKLEAENLDQNK